MLKSRLIYIAFLAAAFFLWVYCNTYGTFTLLLAVIFFPVISLLLLLAGGRKMTVQAMLPKYSEHVDRMEFDVRVENRAFVPTGGAVATLIMQNSLTLAKKTQQISLTARARSVETYRVCVEPVYAGILSLAVAQIIYYDCFRLFRMKQNIKTEQTVRVSERQREVPVLFEELSGTADDSERFSETKPGNDVSELFGMHEYLPGDEIKKINWKISAKYQQLIVRDFSLPQNSMLTIMLELTRAPEKMTDLCVELYLSLSRSLIQAGYPHNVAWYDGGEGAFHSIEITDLETYELARMRLLESYGYEEPEAALKYYMENIYHRSSRTVWYLAVEPDYDYIAEVSFGQPIIPLAAENQLSELIAQE